MAFSLADLLGLKSAAQIYDEQLAYLAGLPVPLPLSNWRTGGPYKTILALQGVIGEKVYALASAFVQSGYLHTATGGWLTLLARGAFGEERMPATFARDSVTVTVAPGAGPYTFGVGDLQVSTPSGLKYSAINPAPVTIAGGASAAIPVQAEAAGAIYNVSPGAITQLDSPTLLGVTVVSTGTTAAGADEEGDDKLRARCLAKWATLGTGSPDAAYQYWALSASSEVQQCVVLSDFRNGVHADKYITLVICGDGAACSPAAAVAVSAAVSPKVFSGFKLAVVRATGLSVPISAQIYAPAALLGVVPGKVQASLETYRRSLPIGGTVQPSAVDGAIFYRELDASGRIVPGPVSRVNLAAPATPTSAAWNQFVTWSYSLTYTGT